MSRRCWTRLGPSIGDGEVQNSRAEVPLLIIEDDETIGRALCAALGRDGYAVRWVRSGHAALAAALDRMPDLVLLDLGLPDLDGAELCRRLRRLLPEAVVVVLSARSDEVDVVLSLEAGADDFLYKPTRLNELTARLRAHRRRKRLIEAPEVVGSLRIDPGPRRVWLGEAEVVLRLKEFDLLARLARDAGRAVSRETLMADVWDEHWFGSTKTLDVHIAAVRRRLAAQATTQCPAPEISTLRGYGYRLERPAGLR